MPPNPRPKWRSFLPGALLFVLVFACYFPCLRGEFLWDDDSNIIKSMPLRSWDGLRRIWFEPRATQQYYPITHTSFWLDYHLWGLHPTAYHLENIFLHSLSALLLWLLLRKLKIPGAWFGAALFALHPVNVETVAWITERKNTLSGVFFLSSLLAAAKFWLPGESPASLPSKPSPESAKPISSAWRTFSSLPSKQSPKSAKPVSPPLKYYWLAVIFYLCGMLSKTAIVGLPAVVLLLLWWKRGRVTWRDAKLILPFAAIAFALSSITIWIEKSSLGATGEEWSFSLSQRFLIAGRAFWFYLGKLAWPHPLMFMYPRWNIEQPGLLDWLPVIAAVALFVCLWRYRKSWARPVLMALGFFVAMLFPVLGFFNVVFYHYSFVNDHFQYLACIGPLTLAAAGLTRVFDLAGKENAVYQPVVRAALIFALAILTWQQTHVYQKLEPFWREALARNPESWMAHDNLGRCLSNRSQFDEAADNYRTALNLHPTDFIAYNNLGLDLARQNKLTDAIQNYQRSLELCPNYSFAHFNLGSAFALGGHYDEAIDQYKQVLALDPDFVPARETLGSALTMQGRVDDAIEQYTKVLELDPDFAPAHANLGRALAANKKIDEAIAHYRRALELEPNSVDALANLGNALFAQGKLDEAITNYRAALGLKNDAAIIHYNLAVALVRQDKLEEARQEFTIVLQLKPGDPNALHQLQALASTQSR